MRQRVQARIRGPADAQFGTTLAKKHQRQEATGATIHQTSTDPARAGTVADIEAVTH